MQHPSNNISIKSGKGQQRINEMSLGKEQEGFNIYNNHLNNHTQDSTAVNNSSDHIHDKDNDGAAENNHRLLRDDEKCIESDTKQ